MNTKKLSKRKFNKILEAAEDDIVDIREKLQTLKGRLEKNLLYHQIENRKAVIKKVDSLIKDLAPGEK